MRVKIRIKKSQVYLVYLYLMCERLANLQNTRSVHVSCMTLHKMAEDVNSDVQLLNSWRKLRIVQICKMFRLQCIKTHSKGQISTDIRFRPNLSIIRALSVSSPAINIQHRTKTRAATLRECHCATSAMLQI